MFVEERAPPPLSPPLEGPEVGVLRSHPQPPPSHAGRVQQWVDRRESTSSPTHTHTKWKAGGVEGGKANRHAPGVSLQVLGTHKREGSMEMRDASPPSPAAPFCKATGRRSQPDSYLPNKSCHPPALYKMQSAFHSQHCLGKRSQVGGRRKLLDLNRAIAYTGTSGVAQLEVQTAATQRLLELPEGWLPAGLWPSFLESLHRG